MRSVDRRTIALRAVLVGIIAATAGVMIVGLESDPGVSDTGRYQGFGEQIASGGLPYRDFMVEYPPGALAPFVLPALFTDTRGEYDAVFIGLMLIALGSITALLVVSLHVLNASAARTAATVAALLVGVALLGPFLLTRFDFYPAAVTLAAICAILHGREKLGSVILGLAIAAKIYPAVLLPLLVTRAWRRDGPSAGLRLLGLTVGTATLVYLPFVILAPERVTRSMWQQVGRPLQIESLGAGVLLVLHNTVGMSLGWSSAAGSQNLTGTVATVASVATSVVGLAVLMHVWVRFARGNTESAAHFVRYSAAAIVGFVAFGKVISPQFLVWLLAVVVLVPGRRGMAASALVLVACALTRAWFPGSYWELVRTFDPTSSWLVLARDLVLVGALAVLVARSRSTEPTPVIER